MHVASPRPYLWRLVVTGVALAIAGISEGLTGAVEGLWRFAWAASAIASSIIGITLTTRDAPSVPDTAPEVEILRAARAMAPRQRAERAAVRTAMARSRVRVTSCSQASNITLAEAPQALAAADGGTVVLGRPGVGKTRLLHSLAAEINSKEVGRSAIVLPLATYDWTADSLIAWAASELSRTTGIPRKQIATLIDSGSLVVLLDGLEDVPTSTARDDATTVWTLSLLDRIRKRPPRTHIDPRLQLIARLDELPRLVLSAQSEAWSQLVGTRALSTLTRFELKPLTEAEALAALEDPIPPPPPGVVTDPLHLTLAYEALVERGLSSAHLGRAEFIEWLWRTHIDYRVAQKTPDDANWTNQKVIRWLGYCLGSSDSNGVFAFRRWPLMVDRRVRRWLVPARNLLQSLIVYLFALSYLYAAGAAVVAALALVGFSVMGEGLLPVPLAMSRFTPWQFVYRARDNANFAILFTFIGALVGLIVSWDIRMTHETSVSALVGYGAASGALLGLVIPTLYDFGSGGDPRLRHPPSSGSARQSAVAAGEIGFMAGIILSAALMAVFGAYRAFFAIPTAVTLAVLDTIGVPGFAVVLGFIRGRNPLRLGAFLRYLSTVGLLKPSGPAHLIEHSELRLKADVATLAPQKATRLTQFVGCCLCSAAALFLIGYSLIVLRTSLPTHYTARHWRHAWVGLDLAMAALAAVTLVGFIRKSAAVIVSGAAYAALAVADAWFDTMTANSRDVTQSLLALLIELPTAAGFLALSVVTLRAHLAPPPSRESPPATEPSDDPAPQRAARTPAAP